MKDQVRTQTPRYGMRARPFGIGAFPRVAIVNLWETSYRESGYHNIVETVVSLTEKQVRDYELIKVSQEDFDRIGIAYLQTTPRSIK